MCENINDLSVIYDENLDKSWLNNDLCVIYENLDKSWLNNDLSVIYNGNLDKSWINNYLKCENINDLSVICSYFGVIYHSYLVKLRFTWVMSQIMWHLNRVQPL